MNTKQHSRRHIIGARLRHEAKMLRLARLHGVGEPWLTIWVKKASNKYSLRDWCNYERQGYSIQECRLDLHDRDDD